MALWGNKDAKTSTGTIAIAANGLVTGSSTVFDNQAAVGDYIAAANKQYRITSITSNTVAQVVAGTLGGAIGAVGTGNTYVLSEKPIYVSAASVGTDANNVFGVDANETAANKSVAHAGWIQRTVGTGNRSGRVQLETLVAGSMITGDANDDTQFPDYKITITSQPQDVSAVDGESATFSVTSTVTSGGVMTYLWQLSTNGTTWTDLESATTATLTFAEVLSADDGNQYRVIVSVTGGASVTSDAATLTVTAE